jgi:hypothetical protein
MSGASVAAPAIGWSALQWTETTMSNTTTRNSESSDAAATSERELTIDELYTVYGGRSHVEVIDILSWSWGQSQTGSS